MDHNNHQNEDMYMDMDMNMDENNHGGMSMDMTFKSFADFKMKLLFESWDITDQYQFTLAWIVVCLLVVCHHGLRFLISLVEKDLKQAMYFPTFGVRTDESYKYFRLRILHAAMNAFSYGLGLILMLIGMTYNPSLFLALVIGYFIGDYLFFTLQLQYHQPPEKDSCH